MSTPGDPDDAAVPPQASVTSERRAAGWRPRAPEHALPDVHLLDYVRVLYKRRWTATTVFLIVLLATAVYTFTATPVYEARTRLLIESGDPNIVSFKEVIDKGPAENDYYQTQYNILQSRTLARETLEALHLWNNPLFAAPPPGRLSQLRDVRGQSDAVRPQPGSDGSGSR